MGGVQLRHNLRDVVILRHMGERGGGGVRGISAW